MLISHLIARSTSVLSKIYTHPFNQQLCNGTLKAETFKFYLEQDALFLLDFSHVLKLIANRCTEQHHALQFKQLSDDMILYEFNIHSRYLRKAEPKTFFSLPKAPPPPKIPAIVHYTNHLFDTVNTASIAEAVASCVPCFFTYNELGQQMNSRCSPDNPYSDWIASYSRPKFTDSTRAIIKTMNEFAEMNLCPLSHQRMSLAFWRSASCELGIFNAVGKDYLHKYDKLAHNSLKCG